MPVPICVVDAFTSKAFGGNPAGVCMLEYPGDEAWMQSVAAEMKHAETAFLCAREGGFDLRWFTPTAEVDLCGHATLAAAHALWDGGHLSRDTQATFHTKSGTLTCRSRGPAIVMDFPAEPVGNGIAFDRGDVVRDLRLDEQPLFVGSNRMDVLVEVASDEIVRRLEPDMEALGKLETRGVIVTSPGAGEYDVVSRFFAPAVGVPEDDATGSAHCCLGPYWTEKLGKDELKCYQASARGAEITVRLKGERVELEGRAVTTLRGELLA